MPYPNGNSEAGIFAFDSTALKIEKLIKSDITLAQSELKKYHPLFEKLSLTQQITYQHLLTEIHVFQGQFILAKQTASDGLSLTLKLASPSILISELLYNRGFSYENLGEIKLATKDYESGLTLAKSMQDKVLIAEGWINLGAIYYLTDQYEQSLIVLNDAYNIAKQTEDEELKGSVNTELGILYAYLKRPEQAMVYYQQAYQHYQKANDIASSLKALANIAINHLAEKQYEQAITVFSTIVNEPPNVALDQIMYRAYSGLAWANLKKSKPNPEVSYHYLLLSKQYLGQLEQYDSELKYYADEAFILFELGQFSQAVESIAKVENMLSTLAPLGHLKMQMRISIIDLKSKTYNALGYFKKAYALQNLRLSLIRNLRDKKHIQSVVEVRLALEAKEADLQQEVLKNNQALQEISLSAAEKKRNKQKVYLFYIAVVALIFSWLLIKVIQGQRRLYQAANKDRLTGIANRRALIRKGTKLLIQAQLKNKALCVLMFDIDFLKTVNDKFGHNMGDQVLKKVVEIGTIHIPEADLFGRFAGEEFLVFLSDTSTAQGRVIAERFRSEVEKYNWQALQASTTYIAITISIGVSNSVDFQENKVIDLTTLINQADHLLYQAKDQNRNRVCTK